MQLPVPAAITQLYGALATAGVIGDRYGNPIQQLVAKYGNYQDDGHDGLDQGSAVGTPVVPMQAGHVDFAGLGQNMPEWCAAKWAFIFGAGGWPSGNIICIDHSAIVGFPFGTYYAHGRQVLVQSGADVGLNTRIMLSGGDPDEQPGSGRSGGPHLHTSAVLLDRVYIARNWGRVDPLQYLPEGWTVPTAPGGIGDPATGRRRTLVGLPGIPI